MRRRGSLHPSAARGPRIRKRPVGPDEGGKPRPYRQYGIGAYRHEPLLVEPGDIRPHGAHDLMPSLMPFQPELFAPSHGWAIELFPAFRGVPLVEAISGMFSFTPDGQSLLGESLDVRGVWVAEAIWVTHAGGAGRVVAEWMVEGSPSRDLHEADLNRFHTHAVSRPYVRARGAQQYREVYDIIHPLQQMESPRGLRRQPFHRRLEELGAVCFESAGWERPQWYEANRELLEARAAPAREGWAARNWSPVQAVEHRAARERVALFDLSPFTKLELLAAERQRRTERRRAEAERLADDPDDRAEMRAIQDEMETARAERL